MRFLPIDCKPTVWIFEYARSLQVFITIPASGAGKTTLLKIIRLLESPDDGKLDVFEYDFRRLSDDEKSKLRLRKIGLYFNSSTSYHR